MHFDTETNCSIPKFDNSERDNLGIYDLNPFFNRELR